MLILNLGEDFDDTIRQEEESCCIIAGLLEDLVLLELLTLKVVNDIMERVVTDVLKVLYLLNGTNLKSLHLVVVGVNRLFHLILEIWKLNEDLLKADL